MSSVLINPGRFGSYEAESETHFARMTTQPTKLRRSQIDRFIKSLKGDNDQSADVWSKGHHCALVAGHNEADAFLDLFGNFDLSKAINVPAGGIVSTGTFAADRGWTSTFGANALDSSYTPASDAVAYNDLSIGAFHRGSVSSSDTFRPAFGVYDGTNYCVGWPWIDGDDKSVAKINKTAGNAYRFGSVITSMSDVFHLANRSTSAGTKMYRNGSELTATGSESGSDGAASSPIYFGGSNWNGAPASHAAQLSVTWIGASLTSNEQLALYDAVDAYLTAIGAI